MWFREIHPEIDLVRIFQNGIKIGEGPGPVVGLVDPLERGRTITIVGVTSLPGCPETLEAFQFPVSCFSPREVANPSLQVDIPGPRFAVGHEDYSGKTVTLSASGTSMPLAGRVYYPAIAAGAGSAPINDGSLRSLPIVALAHLNAFSFVDRTPNSQTRFSCSPGGAFVPAEAHKGYEEFARAIASRGAVVVSVDAEPIQLCNIGQGVAAFDANMIDRRDLVIETVNGLRAGTVQDTRIDQLSGMVGTLELVFGHSRGGQAAIEVASAWGGPNGPAVIAVAPTAGGMASNSSGTGYVRLATPPSPVVDKPLLILSGTHDHDVFHMGLPNYDVATSPSGAAWKAQVLLNGLAHNRFNSNIPSEIVTPVIEAQDTHRDQLLSWGLSFAEAVIWNRTEYKDVFARRARLATLGPSRPTAYHRYRSEAASTVEDFDSYSVGAPSPTVTPMAPTAPVVLDGFDVNGSLLVQESLVLDVAPGSGPSMSRPWVLTPQSISITPMGPVLWSSDQWLAVDMAPNRHSGTFILSLARTEIGAEILGQNYRASFDEIEGIGTRPDLGRSPAAPETFFRTVQVPVQCLVDNAEGLSPPLLSNINAVSVDADPGDNWWIIDDMRVQ